ncbi:MAG: MoxR family ATPase [Candidatus Heimdallarchaeota archaeon]|nr:MoxR family ATPase [Candidatus Heimdallarchaeota archaeon]
MLKSEVLIKKILDEVSTVIVGKREVMELILTGILADGHILFHDVPGNAKTTMAKAFSMVLGIEFKRISFTPDLLPNDILGVSIYNQKTNEFDFKPGPIFTSILLADEINRASPKTQSALLEAMQEKNATIDGKTYTLGPPFIVMATENPLEYEGTFPLPEAQLDRFLIKASVGYPDSAEEEQEVLVRRINRKQEKFQLQSVITRDELIALQNAVENVHVDQVILQYITQLIRATREDPKISVGASPRGSLGLVLACRAWALIHGRNFVNPQDVQDLFYSVIAHRIILRSGDLLTGLAPEAVLQDILERIKAPRLE